MHVHVHEDVYVDVDVDVDERGDVDENGNESSLSHEKLDVYQCAVQFLALSAKLLDGLPAGNSVLADQLKRAALSIPLNIAEGTGKSSPADRRRFYGIARGSAMECGALLDAARVLSLGTAEGLEDGKALLVRIVSMLSKMCR